MAFRPKNAPRGVVETNVNREFEQAERHLRQINAAYAKPDNAGLAVWCMYDYNTFHNVNEPGMVYHGVCDLFRIPKFTYYWHQSELTKSPMTYIVRVDATRAAIFSNCERVRLWQNTGERTSVELNGIVSEATRSSPSPPSEERAGERRPSNRMALLNYGELPRYKEVATQSPDTTFTAPDGRIISYALHHPPFSFTVSPLATTLKAEGLIGNSVVATYEWREPGKPVALAVEADRASITADGADLSRIIVTAVDTNGTAIDTSKAPVTFTIDGIGQLIGENPAKLRAGKMIILAQSGFVASDLTITATSPGLRPAHVTVNTVPVGPIVDMPKNLPALQPSQRTLVPKSTPATPALVKAK
jgi:beta-galactosidase